MSVLVPATAALGVIVAGWTPLEHESTVRPSDDFRGQPFDQPFERYRELCGYPILVARTPHRSQAVEDENGRRIIVIDPSLTEPDESFHRVFMIAHECAHHRMGHSSDRARALRMASRRVVRDQELSADCWAAETLARLGLARYSRIMADRFQRAGLYSPGGGYPSGAQRAAIVRECSAAESPDRPFDRKLFD